MAEQTEPTTIEEAEAIFNAIAAGKNSPEQPAPETPQTEANAEISNEPDPWEGVPQIVKDRLQAISGLETEVKTATGRIGALQRDLHTLGTTAAPKFDTQKWRELEGEWPELAGALKEQLESSRMGASGSTVLRQQMAAMQQQHQADMAMMQVEIKHPDWVSRVNSQEFTQWAQAQPREVQALSQSDNPQDAIRMLDLYAAKDKAKTVAESRAIRRQTSATTVQPNASQPTKASIDDMSPAELFAMYAKEADKRLQMR